MGQGLEDREFNMCMCMRPSSCYCARVLLNQCGQTVKERYLGNRELLHNLDISSCLASSVLCQSLRVAQICSTRRSRYLIIEQTVGNDGLQLWYDDRLYNVLHVQIFPTYINIGAEIFLELYTNPFIVSPYLIIVVV
jgi:hypothetical protein